MTRRPLTCVVCLFTAGLIALTICLPSFPLENRLTRYLGELACAEESVTVSGCVRSVTVYDGGDTAVLLAPAYVTAAGMEEGDRPSKAGPSVRVRRLTVSLSEIEAGQICTEAGSDPVNLTGRRLTATGRLREVPRPTNPGQFDSWLSLRLKGCPYRLYSIRSAAVSERTAGLWGAAARLSAFGRERIVKVFPSSQAGIFAALLIGDRTLMEEGQAELWRQSGTAHILAISGLHLTLIGMALFAFLRFCRLSIKAASAVSAAAVGFYALMTGLSVSSVRAFIMLAYTLGARALGRCPDRFNAVSLAAVLILIEDPAYLLDAGFQLSFAAVVILAVFAGRGRLKTAALLFMLPLPLIACHFHEIPLFGLVFNLILVPLVPAVFVIGLIGMLFGGPAAFTGSGLVFLAEQVFEAVRLRLPLTWVTGRPYLWQCLLYEALLFAVILLFRRIRHLKRRFALVMAAPLLILVLIRPSPGTYSLTMLDVGQGESLVSRSPGPVTCLIDSGSTSLDGIGERRLIPYLMYEGIRHVDYLFVTHMDEDHISGVEELLEMAGGRKTSLRVGTLVLPYRPWAETAVAEAGDSLTRTGSLLAEKDNKSPAEVYARLAFLAEEAGARVLVMHRGDRVIIPEKNARGCRTVIEALGPDPACAYESENAASLVLAVHYGAFDALLTGDVTGGGETGLMAALADGKTEKGGKGQIRYEILKVAHHGSRYSTAPSFLAQLKPQAALISCGRYNYYGHPHKELLQRLDQSGAAVFRTDRNGAVEVTTDGEKYSVRCFGA